MDNNTYIEDHLCYINRIHLKFWRYGGEYQRFAQTMLRKDLIIRFQAARAAREVFSKRAERVTTIPS